MSQGVTAKMLKSDFNSKVSDLMHGYLFHEQRPLQPIAFGEVCTRYQALVDDRASIWLHLNLNHVTAERQLTSHFPAADFFFEEIHNGLHIARIERQEENLFAVFNDALFRPQDTNAETATLWLYCNPKLVVTARFKPLRFTERMLSRLQTLRMSTSIELLAFLLEEQEEMLEQVVRQASHHVGPTEGRLLNNHMQRNWVNLARLRRMLLRFQRLLAPEPTAMPRPLNRPPTWMDHVVVRVFRQFIEEFGVMFNDLSGLIERVNLLQEEIGARQLGQSNHALYTLTVITAFALPINIVAGFSGMNVGGIPLASSHHGFILLVVIVAIFIFGTGYLTFHRRGDLQVARRIS